MEEQGIHSTTNNALASTETTARKSMRNRIVSVLVIAVVVVGASVGAAAAARRRRDRANSAFSSASAPSSSLLRLGTGDITRTFIRLLRTNQRTKCHSVAVSLPLTTWWSTESNADHDSGNTTDSTGINVTKADAAPPTKFCTKDVQECPDGSFVGRDPNNDCAFAPCEVNCEACPGGFFDGCNHCACTGEGGGGPICTLMACGAELAPMTCNQTSPDELLSCTLDVQECADGSFVGRDPANGCSFFSCPSEEEDVNCETCACGYNDGCNDCQCSPDGSSVASCTKLACIWQGIPKCLDCSDPPPTTVEFCTLDVQACPDGSLVGRDPQNDCAFSPCKVDCVVCPGGFFDGCNHCACGTEESGPPICTLMACAGPELQPKTCHQKPPVLVVCTADARVCPDGSSVGRDPANDCEFVPCP
jgi:hypothetical protein